MVGWRRLHCFESCLIRLPLRVSGFGCGVGMSHDLQALLLFSSFSAKRQYIVMNKIEYMQSGTPSRFGI